MRDALRVFVRAFGEACGLPVRMCAFVLFFGVRLLRPSASRVPSSFAGGRVDHVGDAALRESAPSRSGRRCACRHPGGGSFVSCR